MDKDIGNMVYFWFLINLIAWSSSPLKARDVCRSHSPAVLFEDEIPVLKKINYAQSRDNISIHHIERGQGPRAMISSLEHLQSVPGVWGKCEVDE